MNTSIVVIVVIACLVIAGVLWYRRKKASTSASSGTASAAAPAKPDPLAAAVAELKQHMEQIMSAGIASAKLRMATVGDLIVQRQTGSLPSPATGTMNAAAAAIEAAAKSAPVQPAAQAPTPAAPANPPVAVDPPPATTAAAASPAQPAAGGGGTETPYPKIVAVHGVNMRLDAPVSADYRPSMTAWIFGHQANTFVGEPSNGAKVGMPLRSAAGYPLFYAIGGDGKVVGTPSVLQGDQQFNSDAEVTAFNATTTQTPEQAAQQSADWARVTAAIGAQTPPHAPVPAARTQLEATYANAAALKADIVALKFTGAVTLDGAVINSGFGKPDGSPYAYATQPDGSVKAA